MRRSISGGAIRRMARQNSRASSSILGSARRQAGRNSKPSSESDMTYDLLRLAAGIISGRDRSEKGRQQSCRDTAHGIRVAAQHFAQLGAYDGVAEGAQRHDQDGGLDAARLVD